jgi:hypothetical protein
VSEPTAAVAGDTSEVSEAQATTTVLPGMCDFTVCSTVMQEPEMGQAQRAEGVSVQPSSGAQSEAASHNSSTQVSWVHHSS